MPRFLRRERWSLKPPFHPCPHLSARAVFSLWHCLSASPYVVTSRVYLRPDRSYAAPCPMEFGLSSRNLRCERGSMQSNVVCSDSENLIIGPIFRINVGVNRLSPLATTFQPGGFFLWGTAGRPGLRP